MSTKAERRAERRKQRGRARSSGRSFPWFTVLVVGVVVVFGFVLLRSLGVFEPTTPSSSAPTFNPSQIQLNQGQEVPVMGAEHLKPGESFTSYNSTPPSSGPHWAVQGQGPIPWQVYSTQQRNEGVVHNLEHGGVLIAYDPSLSEQDVTNLKAIRARWPKDHLNLVKIIVEPYAGLGQGTIALTAWGFIDKMQAYDERRIVGFIAAHINRGPEPNAP